MGQEQGQWQRAQDRNPDDAIPSDAVSDYATDKNAYGGGYPWSAAHTRQDISYDLTQYPVSQACIDACLWNVNNHRPPNGSEQIEALAKAVRKVFTQLDEVPVEKVG